MKKFLVLRLTITLLSFLMTINVFLLIRIGVLINKENNAILREKSHPMFFPLDSLQLKRNYCGMNRYQNHLDEL